MRTPIERFVDNEFSATGPDPGAEAYVKVPVNHWAGVNDKLGRQRENNRALTKQVAEWKARAMETIMNQHREISELKIELGNVVSQLQAQAGRIKALEELTDLWATKMNETLLAPPDLIAEGAQDFRDLPEPVGEWPEVEAEGLPKWMNGGRTEYAVTGTASGLTRAQAERYAAFINWGVKCLRVNPDDQYYMYKILRGGVK
jgi:hypothetical protein